MNVPARWKKRITWSLISLGAFTLAFLLSYAHFFGPADKTAATTQFIVLPEDTTDSIVERLSSEKFIRSDFAAQIALLKASAGKSIRPGGYSISASMDAWSIADTLARPPYVVWIKIPRGFRKEQIADLLADELGWDAKEKEEWLTVDTEPSASFSEGVYYPTTYLIPSEETPAQIAERMRTKFKEAYAPLSERAKKQGVPWTEVLVIASLIDREARDKNDMPIISGIIWNRLAKKMPLGIDATLQYIKGTDDEWWGTVHAEDKYLTSPYNTYFKAGLPPAPIDNPGPAAIAAALNPATTTCLYYLHDGSGDIHCANTYKAHVANVYKYLK